MTRYAWLCSLLIACNGPGPDKSGETQEPDETDTPTTDDTDTPPVTTEGIGPDGGEVEGSGVTVNVPAGAVTNPVEISITIQDPGVALPEGWEAAGDVFAVTPHGTTFATPIRLTFPDAGLTDEEGGVLVLSDPTDTTWEEVTEGDWFSGEVTVSTDHLSFWRVARRVVPATCDHAAATAALAQVDVGGARNIYAGCTAAFPDDGAARLGHALTTLLTADRWSPVATIYSWCHESADIEAVLYGPQGFVAALRDSWTQTTTMTTADRVAANGNITPVPVLATPLVGTAALDTQWAESGTIDVVDVDIYEERGEYTRISFEIPLGTTGAWQPDNLDNIYLSIDDDTWPAYASEYYTESASFVVRQLGDQAGEAIEIDYDVTFREYCARGACGALHYAGTVIDTIDKSAEDYAWPFEGRTSVTETQPTHWSAFFPELDYQCDVPSFASIYTVIDDLITQLDALQAEFEQASTDPNLRFTFPKDALWFLGADLEVGPGDAQAIAAAIESATASLRLAKMYKLVDETRSLDAFAGSVELAEFDWDTGGGGSGDCTRTQVLGDDPVAAAEDLGAHALELRDAATTQAARDALDHLMQTLIDVLAIQPPVGLFDPSVAQIQPAVGRLTDDLEAVRQSFATNRPTPLPSSPTIDIDLGGFFAAPPDRTSILMDLAIPGFVMAAQPEPDECGSEWLRFHDDFLRWASRGAGGANIPERIYDNGFPPNQTPSVIDGDLWESTINSASDWPYYLHHSLKQSIIW